MTWWIYKCNSGGRARSHVRGDWGTNFDWQADDCKWGEIEALPALAKLRSGHRIVALQSDRREIAGVLEVVRIEHGHVHLKPLIRFSGVDVGYLKKHHLAVRRMKAFAQGRIATLYAIAAAEAKYLLRQCAVGMVKTDVERLFQTKSLWRDIGPLRLPNPRWKLGLAADAWAAKLGLPPDAVKIIRPLGQPARRDKTLGALQKEWQRKA